jgi:RNA polymerase sigma factor (TIGR02999 family)
VLLRDDSGGGYNPLTGLTGIKSAKRREKDVNRKHQKYLPPPVTAASFLHLRDTRIAGLSVAGDAQDRASEIVADLSGEGGGTPTSTEELLQLVYEDLRRLAERYMSRERRGHTLQPTALVHEVYLKLVDQTRANWKGRSHFFAVGARVMRRLLIDHARGRGREKRGGARQRVTLAESLSPSAERGLDFEELLSLNTALEQLAAVEARAAQVVEMRFFGGLTIPEVAHVLGVSTRTVEGDWTYARAWLRRELSGEVDP